MSIRPTIILASAIVMSLATTLSPTALADDPPIETIVVEATRLNQSQHEMGSSVYVIDGEDIQAAGYDFLVDALAAAPGVTINQNGTYGGSASVRIRGASSDQTMVLIDGVQVNDPSSPGGAFDFARLDPANIEQIEILSGPQSTLWGSDAIGGVISIVTKRPQEQFQGDVFFEYGSEATARAGLSISNAGAAGNFRIGVAAIDSDGISKADENNGNSEEDGYESVSVTAQGELNLPRDITLGITAHQNAAEAEFDSFVFGAQGNVGDGDQLSDTEEWSGQVRLVVPTLDGRLEHEVIVGYSDIERENFSNGASSFSADGDRQIYRYLGRYQINEANTLAFGVERENTESGSDDNRIDSVFGLWETKPTQDLTLTFGLRNDDIEDGASETTARAAFAYQASDVLTVRGSWGQGFKAPTLFQRTFFCCGALAPNPGLRPEESDGFDLGLDWQAASDDTSISATYFNQETTDQINFSFALGGYENIDEVDSQGLELAIFQRLTDALSLDFTYAYIDAEDNNGDPLVRIPEQTADLRFTYRPAERWSLTAVLRYNDSEPDPNGAVDDWVRGDLSGHYQISDTFELFARIENIADTEYQQILGYGTPDRSFALSVQARF
ncbi:MAG: TonB-dependent receptor [Pseudomonadota bacterium]